MKLNHIAWRLRPVGWILLVGGATVLGLHFLNVSSSTHPLWIYHAQQLPEGDMVSRAAAVGEMRQFQLAANWVFRRLIVLPTAALFCGGVLLGIARAPKGESEH